MTKDVVAQAAEDEAVPEDNAEQAELPLREDANKTRPAGRRKKKPLVDADGQLRPSVVLNQLQKLKGSLESLDSRASQEQAQLKSRIFTNKTNELLSRLNDQSLDRTANDAEDVDTPTRPRSSALRTDATSVLDDRLHELERYVGAEQSEGDEVGALAFNLVAS